GDRAVPAWAGPGPLGRLPPDRGPGPRRGRAGGAAGDPLPRAAPHGRGRDVRRGARRPPGARHPRARRGQPRLPRTAERRRLGHGCALPPRRRPSLDGRRRPPGPGRADGRAAGPVAARPAQR
ncbi:MAG: hypothetical protein AVDCRST_MAG48-2094, partial [uncultured Friedmanniella sp.]